MYSKVSWMVRKKKFNWINSKKFTEKEKSLINWLIDKRKLKLKHKEKRKVRNALWIFIVSSSKIIYTRRWVRDKEREEKLVASWKWSNDKIEWCKLLIGHYEEAEKKTPERIEVMTKENNF